MSLNFARYKRWVDDQRKEREIAGRKVLYHLEDAESMQWKHEALLQQHSQISGRYALEPGQEVIFQKDPAFERSYQWETCTKLTMPLRTKHAQQCRSAAKRAGGL